MCLLHLIFTVSVDSTICLFTWLNSYCCHLMTLDGGSNLMMENKQLDKPPWWTGSKGETGLVCSYIQHLEAVILGCFSRISSSINQRSLSFVSRWRWKSIPTWPKSQPVLKWHYVYIYIFFRERERDHVSLNNNHRKSHQKTQTTVILAVGTRSVSGFLIMMLCRVSQVS